MVEYLKYVCAKRNISAFIVFNEAFRKHYGCVGNVTEDLSEYVFTGKLPYYVRAYLEDIRDAPFI